MKPVNEYTGKNGGYELEIISDMLKDAGVLSVEVVTQFGHNMRNGATYYDAAVDALREWDL